MIATQDEDKMVREMLTEFERELKQMVHAKRAYYDGHNIIGVDGDYEAQKRCAWLQHQIKTYNVAGSIPRLVELAKILPHVPEESFNRNIKHAVNTYSLAFRVPREVMPYMNDMRRFFDAMSYKLRKHAHKGRWENMALEEVLGLLSKEIIELRDAVAEGNTVEIVLEAADVANFAMIAASIAMDGDHVNGTGRVTPQMERQMAEAGRLSDMDGEPSRGISVREDSEPVDTVYQGNVRSGQWPIG